MFGYTGNEEITKGLLNAILKEKVTDVSLNCNTILERDLYDDKLGILDIRAKVNNAVDTKYLTKWNIREETYGKIILTDVLEFYIIEMPKINKYSSVNTLLDTWVKFISNSEGLNMENADESIKKAKEVLDEISEDEHEQYLAHLREKYIFERQGIEEAGFDKGVKASKIEIAKKLKENNIDIEIITKCTGLTKEEIENI